MKDRKELFAGTTGQCSDFITNHTSPERLEVVANERGPHSVFFKRKATDRSIKRPITRETRQLFRVNGVTKNHHRPLKVTLEPGDVISFCPKGTAQRVTVPIASLYNFARFTAARAIINAKRAAKKTKKRR